MIQLIFKSPKELNSLSSSTNLTAHEWRFKSIDGSILELNTDNWEISNGQLSVKINKWGVDESNKLMDLKDNNKELDDLDYAFAVSMIGQLVDRSKLIQYLKSLSEVYEMKNEESNDSPQDTINKI